MPLNTQFPSWMQEQTRSDQATGVALGRNMLEGMRLRQQEQQFNAEAPLRQAQVVAANAQAQAAVNRANAEAFALKNQKDAIGSTADFQRLISDFAGSPGGYSPENRARMYSFFADHPAMAYDPLAKQQNDLFDAADAFREKADQERLKLESSEREAKLRADAMKDLGELPTAAMKNTKAQIDAELASGELQNDPTAIAKRTAELQGAGGKQRFLSPAILDSLVNRSTVLEAVDGLNQQVLDFNKQFGEGAIDRYLGKFDKPFNQVLDIIRKRKNPEDVAALALVQNLAGIKNRTLLTRSGRAVTANELTRVEEEIGTVADQNLPLRLRNFGKAERRYLQSTANQYKGFPIPDETNAIIFGTVPQGTMSSATPASSGIKVISIEPAP